MGFTVKGHIPRSYSLIHRLVAFALRPASCTAPPRASGCPRDSIPAQGSTLQGPCPRVAASQLPLSHAQGQKLAPDTPPPGPTEANKSRWSLEEGTPVHAPHGSQWPQVDGLLLTKVRSLRARPPVGSQACPNNRGVFTAFRGEPVLRADVNSERRISFKGMM